MATRMANKEVPDCSIQKVEITPLLKKRYEKNDIWYLLDVRWFKQWKKYVGFESWDQQKMGSETAHPGPVDTSCLFKDQEREILKDHLEEDLDYSLVPEEVWKKFTSWYGIEESSRPIPRRVVEHGLYVKHCKVEVYLVELRLALHPEVNSTVTKEFSRADTVEHVVNTMKQLYNIPEEKECRLWYKYILNTYDLLNKFEETIINAGLYSKVLLVLEQKNDDGTWPRNTFTRGNMMKSIDYTDTSRGHSALMPYTDESGDAKSRIYHKHSAKKQPTHATPHDPPGITDKENASMIVVKDALTTIPVRKGSAKHHPHKHHQHSRQVQEKQKQTNQSLTPKLISHSQTIHQVNTSSASVKLNDPVKKAGELMQTKPTIDDVVYQKMEGETRSRPEEKLQIKEQEVKDGEYPKPESSTLQQTLQEKDNGQETAALSENLKQSQREITTILERLQLKEKELSVVKQEIAVLQERMVIKEKDTGEEIATLTNKLEEAKRETSLVNTTLLEEIHQNKTEANQKITTLSENLQLKENKLNIANQEIATLREASQENAALLQRLHQNKATADKEITTLSEQLLLKEEELTILNQEVTTLQGRIQENEMEQLERLQAQETQLQTFCNNALQQMRQQMEAQMHQQMQQITNQMTMMQKVFNAVKPQWLISRCEITLTQHELGNGGWGRVVQATFRNGQVAAKCLHHQIISEYNVQHFVREMQISSKCHHPNLLRFLGATLEGDPIILTELMDTNLYDVIRRHELKDHQIIPLLQDIASAINYLHNLSPEPIIHRDISSSNVLLNGPVRSKWIVKLSDFGSANFLWHTSDQSKAPGNPTYAAPEVLSPHSHSEKMDVYSFGVLLFEICSGQAPSLQLRNELLPTAAAVWPEPYHHFVPLIVLCTKHNKDKRPTMSDVLAEL